MTDLNVITLPRKQLYDEIWELSVLGVAKKYNLQYQHLLKSCRGADIPFPRSGYWTRLKCGKDVTQEVIQLPDSKIENVTLLLNGYKVEKKKEENKNEIKVSKTVYKKEIETEDNTSEANKINEQQNESKIEDQKSANTNLISSSVLMFLEDDERKKVLDVITTLKIRENRQLHPRVIKYKEAIAAWNKHQKELNDPLNRSNYRYMANRDIKKPLYIDSVAPDTLPRVYGILDALFNAVEILGGKIDSDLDMCIFGENTSIRIAEGQDKIKHELTKQEAKSLVEYNDKIKHDNWASKPYIPSHDNIFNGKLRVVFSDSKYIRDNVNEKIEDKLGEILIKLCEEAEGKMIERKRQDEIRRIREENERIEEEKRQRKKHESIKTLELVNEAEDYKVACEIRSYIAAVEKMPYKTEEINSWIEWAKKKADWYDPVICRVDELLGERKHKNSKEEKELIKETQKTYWGSTRY